MAKPTLNRAASVPISAHVPTLNTAASRARSIQPAPRLEPISENVHQSIEQSDDDSTSDTLPDNISSLISTGLRQKLHDFHAASKSTKASSHELYRLYQTTAPALAAELPRYKLCDLFGDHVKALISTSKKEYSHLAGLLDRVKSGPWALTPTDIDRRFGPSVSSSIRGLRILSELAKHASLDQARPIINQARQDRIAGRIAYRGPDNADCVPRDFETALKRFKPASSRISSNVQPIDVETEALKDRTAHDHASCDDREVDIPVTTPIKTREQSQELRVASTCIDPSLRHQTRRAESQDQSPPARPSKRRRLSTETPASPIYASASACRSSQTPLSTVHCFSSPVIEVGRRAEEERHDESSMAADTDIDSTMHQDTRPVSKAGSNQSNLTVHPTPTSLVSDSEPAFDHLPQYESSDIDTTNDGHPHDDEHIVGHADAPGSTAIDTILDMYQCPEVAPDTPKASTESPYGDLATILGRIYQYYGISSPSSTDGDALIAIFKHVTAADAQALEESVPLQRTRDWAYSLEAKLIAPIPENVDEVGTWVKDIKDHQASAVRALDTAQAIKRVSSKALKSTKEDDELPEAKSALRTMREATNVIAGTALGTPMFLAHATQLLGDAEERYEELEATNVARISRLEETIRAANHLVGVYHSLVDKCRQARSGALTTIEEREKELSRLKAALA